MEKLIKIQSELKAPKGQLNKFGGYKYRSCEDILEAVKPLCARENVQLTISDEIVQIGDRYYVKATASVTDGNETVSVHALAREEETKKGMDASQLTGATSSYARKNALNGLFCIDDTKDADTDEFTERTKGTSKKQKADAPKSNELTYREKLIIYAKEAGIPFAELAKDYGLNSQTTEERFKEVLEDLEGK